MQDIMGAMTVAIPEEATFNIDYRGSGFDGRDWHRFDYIGGYTGISHLVPSGADLI